MDRGLLQEQVADELGVSVSTILNWERNRTKVATRSRPKVVAFLGYDPSPEPETLSARIRRVREQEGLSQEELARKLGLNPSSVRAWERNEIRKPHRRLLRVFEEYLTPITSS
jgi:transcriptional regulator with XRE-family HTH domain